METTEQPSTGLQAFLAYHRRMLFLLTGVCIVVAACLLAFIPSDRTWAAGFAVGAAAQMLKFGFLDVGVVRSIALNPESAPMQQLKSRYGTMVILAIAIIAALKFGLNVWALAAGVLLPRVMYLADAYLRPNVFAKSKAQPSPCVDGDKEP